MEMLRESSSDILTAKRRPKSTRNTSISPLIECMNSITNHQMQRLVKPHSTEWERTVSTEASRLEAKDGYHARLERRVIVQDSDAIGADEDVFVSRHGVVRFWRSLVSVFADVPVNLSL